MRPFPLSLLLWAFCVHSGESTSTAATCYLPAWTPTSTDIAARIRSGPGACSSRFWTSSEPSQIFSNRHLNLIRRRRITAMKDAAANSASSSSPRVRGTPQDEDPRCEPRVAIDVEVPLPLGLVLEEMDANDSTHGVVVMGMSAEGNAAKHNKSPTTTVGAENSPTRAVCIRDKILAVNGVPCAESSLDAVISLFSDAGTSVTISLGRIEGSTVLYYPNGAAVAAKPGESYGFLARICGARVEYACRNGNCRICERAVETDRDQLTGAQGEEGYRLGNIFHCVGSVPRSGYQWIRVIDQYA